MTVKLTNFTKPKTFAKTKNFNYQINSNNSNYFRPPYIIILSFNFVFILLNAFLFPFLLFQYWHLQFKWWLTFLVWIHQTLFYFVYWNYYVRFIFLLVTIHLRYQLKYLVLLHLVLQILPKNRRNLFFFYLLRKLLVILQKQYKITLFKIIQRLLHKFLFPQIHVFQLQILLVFQIYRVYVQVLKFDVLLFAFHHFEYILYIM